MAPNVTTLAPPWLTQLAMALCGLVAYGFIFPDANLFTDLPAVLTLQNPALYGQDFYVQEMTQFTPRFYYFWALILPMKLGLSLPMVSFIYWILAFVGFSLGLYAIGLELGKSKLSAAVLAFLGLAVADGTVGFADLFRRTPIPSMYAMGITIWGVYFCLKQQWVRGYLLFGISCLVQFLIGLLPGLLLTPALLFHSVRAKNLKQSVVAWGVLLLLAALVYGPMVLSGNTSSDLLSDVDFVWLYGYVRHPHHIVMSSFSLASWRRFGFFTLAGCLGVWATQHLSRAHKTTLGLGVLTGLVLLLMGYGLVEVYPVALVSKLQLSRVSPFILLLNLAAIAVYASDQYQRGNRALALSLVVAPVVDNAGGLITLVLVLGTTLNLGPSAAWLRLNRWINRRIWLAYGLCLILLVVTYNYQLVLFLSFAYPFLWDEFPGVMKRLRLATYGVVAVSGLFLLLQLGGVVQHRSLSPVHRAIKIQPLADQPIKSLAVNFRNQGPVDALVLVPPSDRDFRFYSQRSVLVTFKNFPFTDAGMLTWQRRMKALLGELPAHVEGVLDQRFSQRTGAELGAIAANYNVTHILTRQSWHPDIPGTLVDQQEDWVLWDVRDGS